MSRATPNIPATSNSPACASTTASNSSACTSPTCTRRTFTGVAAVSVLAASGMLASGCSDPFGIQERAREQAQAQAREEAQARIEDAKAEAARVGKQMAEASEHAVSIQNNPTSESYEQRLAEARTKQKETIDENLDRISTARQVLQNAQKWPDMDTDELARAEEAIASIADVMVYEKALLRAEDELARTPDRNQVSFKEWIMAFYDATWQTAHRCSETQAPVCLADLHDRFIKIWDVVPDAVTHSYLAEHTSLLEEISMFEMADWRFTKSRICRQAMDNVAATQYRFATGLLDGSIAPDDAPSVTYTAIDVVAPNLYPSLSSILDITISTTTEREIAVEVELAGFTQKHTEKYTLQPGTSFLSFRPEVLPDLQAENLEHSQTTQLNFTITDADGHLIEAQSESVELLSLYDFFWRDDEFGATVQFDMLAWLRPESPRINALNLRAADFMGDWTGGANNEIAGYLYGQDWSSTMLQAAAIQAAISDNDMTYIIDTYSSSADQRVLTPDQSLAKHQALCVESVLIMASCLMSAGMHPFLVISPTHAQVAVETWEDSGNCIPLETTVLPYYGVDLNVSQYDTAFYNGLVPIGSEWGAGWPWLANGGSREDWQSYLDSLKDGSDKYGGVFIVDCNLHRALGIHGLEGM